MVYSILGLRKYDGDDIEIHACSLSTLNKDELVHLQNCILKNRIY